MGTEIPRCQAALNTGCERLDLTLLLESTVDDKTKHLIEAARAALDALSCDGGPDDPGHRCSHCDDYVDRNGPVREALRVALDKLDKSQ